MNKELKENIENLGRWIAMLDSSAKDDLPEIERILFDKNHKILEGCPSRASEAGLILRNTAKKLSEVNAAFKELEKNLFK